MNKNIHKASSLNKDSFKAAFIEQEHTQSKQSKTRAVLKQRLLNKNIHKASSLKQGSLKAVLIEQEHTQSKHSKQGQF